MKKAAVLLLCLLAAAGMIRFGAAEAGQTVPALRDMIRAEEDAKPFSFRDGIGWNMDMGQVKALENVPMTERSADEWSVMITAEKVAVSRFTADLVFMFYQNRLKMITYEFPTNGSALNFQYLLGALCSVYGDNRSAEAIVIKSIMDQVFPDHYRTESIRQAYAWTAEDGTNIYLYYFNETTYAILYTSPELKVQNSGGYEVNGL